MLRDWDLWPIYLDQNWVDAEGARRIAEINAQIAAVVEALNRSLPSAKDAMESLHRAFAHPATRK